MTLSFDDGLENSQGSINYSLEISLTLTESMKNMAMFTIIGHA